MTQSSLDPTDLPRAFELAAEAGADAVEVGCDRLEDCAQVLEDDGTARINRLKNGFGLAVPSVSLGLLKQERSLFGPEAVAAEAAEHINAAIDAAGRVGAKIVLLPFFGKATIELEKELDRVLEGLVDLAEVAEEAGLTLGIESTLNVDQQLRLLVALGAYTSVKIYYDTGTGLARKLDPATSLRQLGKDNLCQIHFRDVRLGTGGRPPDWEVALGEGDVDFSAVASALKAMDYDGWIILETPPTDDPAGAARANLAFARKLLG